MKSTKSLSSLYLIFERTTVGWSEGFIARTFSRYPDPAESSTRCARIIYNEKNVNKFYSCILIHKSLFFETWLLINMEYLNLHYLKFIEWLYLMLHLAHKSGFPIINRLNVISFTDQLSQTIFVPNPVFVYLFIAGPVVKWPKYKEGFSIWLVIYHKIVLSLAFC